MALDGVERRLQNQAPAVDDKFEDLDTSSSLTAAAHMRGYNLIRRGSSHDPCGPLAMWPLKVAFWGGGGAHDPCRRTSCWH